MNEKKVEYHGHFHLYSAAVYIGVHSLSLFATEDFSMVIYVCSEFSAQVSTNRGVNEVYYSLVFFACVQVQQKKRKHETLNSLGDAGYGICDFYFL